MVFRKGGHHSARGRWYYGTERLEVVNTYRYLGLTFSMRLSFKVATDGEQLTRAKHGTVEILKTLGLRRLNCFSPGLFFKLFDAQIVPSLLYGSELWGFEPYDTVEKVHIQACKLLLNVPSYTPNDMVLGDLGRFLLFVNSAARCVQYLFQLLKQPLNRYSRKRMQCCMVCRRETAQTGTGWRRSSFSCATMVLVMSGCMAAWETKRCS